ncbi:MAG: FMN-binding protein [Clostridia bacterium]|nr:FMN-binding protein [Clostridia bacterium]
MNKGNSALKMILTLVVIAAVIALAMSYVNRLTAPIIEQNAKDKLNQSLSEVLKADEYTVLSENDEAVVYGAIKEGQQIGVCVVNSAKGYGGDIKVMSGILNDGTVSKIEILEMSETPGLGANAGNEKFKAQYEGKSENIGVSKTNPGKTDILAISGATITSKAVTEAVNDAIVIAKQWGDK